MAKRIQLTELEAYYVKGEKSADRHSAFLRLPHGLKSLSDPLTNLPK